ncbi:hypothetical protein WR25_08367 [Diploscapter pachys]|uniref:Mitochondrial import inner membrane translocase subunit tim-16 n=1 Tax=Diploscapter pachys TaxID=2018661 RepID=A0A2A2L2F5_9BILA|nr:hypothetical protein WR25_08367 [Diploscapter pachys]
MPWKHAVKVVLAAGEALGKALTKAVREELKQSQHAATRHAEKTGQTASEAQQSATSNAKLGISLEESIQILNVSTPLSPEEVQKRYDQLFAVNDKAKGGSFYLQSKVYRAKERIDEEFVRLGIQQKKESDEGQEQKQQLGDSHKEHKE